MTKANFDALASYLPVATFVVDRQGKVLRWSQQAARATGCAAHRIMGQPLWTAFSATERIMPTQEVVQTGEPCEQVISWRHLQSGETMSANLRANPGHV